MARKALPTNSLDKLLDEVTAVREHTRPEVRRVAKTRVGRLPKTKHAGVGATNRRGERKKAHRDVETPFARNHDALVRYAASRGVMLGHGFPPLQAARLAAKMAADVMEVSRRDGVMPWTVVSRALAGYLVDNA